MGALFGATNQCAPDARAQPPVQEAYCLLLHGSMPPKKKGGLSNEMLADIEEVFHIFDRDSDGSLTASELHRALWKLGCTCGRLLSKCVCDQSRFPSEAVCEGYVKEFDKDADGALQLEE